jgi:hypothetical protein
MLEQDRSLLYDLSVALGLLIALFLYAPAYLLLAAGRNVANAGGSALRHRPAARWPGMRIGGA